ncbi:LacI family transcriptional regulator (plasmid) [Pantoea cypripedii]|uniref:LacI family transcriptional regulator n=1 Tax=Pantoea cypripedii TaxID=55209 RepID=A0A6B9GEM4_PANCY|nr:LacI family transcriptional regulator [Pantoea cypripedii]
MANLKGNLQFLTANLQEEITVINRKKTTLEQIASAAGVSLSTVDRVMNRRGGVSPAKEARVLEWASKLNVDRVLFRGYLRALRVAILLQSPKNPFYKGLRDAFADLGAGMAEMRINGVIHYHNPGNIRATIKQVETIAASHDALIVVCPNDPDLADALKRVSGQLPILTLATDIPSSGRLAYVGPDNRQMGRAAGELMGRFLGERGGEILVVLGMHNMIGHEERERGFRAVLRERFPACIWAVTLESAENQRRAGDVVRQALLENPRIRGIYNTSSGNSNIVATLQSLGRQAQLITHELTPERRLLLREGSLAAIIDQNPYEEARRALALLARHFNRSEEFSLHDNITPFNLFIRENCPAEGGLSQT